MESWRATRPVDVARLNSGIFLAVLKKFALVSAICGPFYFAAILILAELRAPQLSTGFVLEHVWLYFIEAFVAHLAFGWIFLAFAVAVGSLVWWRHIFAVGRPSPILAAFAFALRRVVRRLTGRPDTDLVAVPARRERANRARVQPTLLDQLRSSLSISSTAPPIPPEAHVVRIDSQLTARRIA